MEEKIEKKLMELLNKEEISQERDSQKSRFDRASNERYGQSRYNLTSNT